MNLPTLPVEVLGVLQREAFDYFVHKINLLNGPVVGRRQVRISKHAVQYELSGALESTARQQRSSLLDRNQKRKKHFPTKKV